jgi:hypothetical protein
MYSQSRLTKRGSVYYFRSAIPKDLVKHYGEKEIIYFLRTNVHKVAKSSYTKASAELDGEFQTLREGMVATQPRVLSIVNEQAVASICSAWKYHTLEDDATYRAQGLSKQEFEEGSLSRLETIESLRETLMKGRIELIQPASAKRIREYPDRTQIT